MQGHSTLGMVTLGLTKRAVDVFLEVRASRHLVHFVEWGRSHFCVNVDPGDVRLLSCSFNRTRQSMLRHHLGGRVRTARFEHSEKLPAG